MRGSFHAAAAAPRVVYGGLAAILITAFVLTLAWPSLSFVSTLSSPINDPKALSPDRSSGSGDERKWAPSQTERTGGSSRGWRALCPAAEEVSLEALMPNQVGKEASEQSREIWSRVVSTHADSDPSPRSSIACCGHRGARREAPENTIPSFELALERGANCVEMDVHMTRDGQLAVVHGTTFRTKLASSLPPLPSLQSMQQEGQGGWEEGEWGKSKEEALRVEDLPWEVVGQADAGGWFDPKFTHTPLPSLTHVVQHFWHVDITLALDLKIDLCGENRQKEQVQNSAGAECVSEEEWADRYAETLVTWLDAVRPSNASLSFLEAPHPRLRVLLTSFHFRLIDSLFLFLDQPSPRAPGPLRQGIAGLAYIYGPNDTSVALVNHIDPRMWLAPHFAHIPSLREPYKTTSKPHSKRDDMSASYSPLHDRSVLSWVIDEEGLMASQYHIGVRAITTNDPALCSRACMYLSPKCCFSD
ncbi:unnamed protein product [Closterium sp. NIES-54]